MGTSSFLRVTNKIDIGAVLDAYVRGETNAGSPHFIPAIFSREQHPGGTSYEGTRPIGVSTEVSGEKTYSLANSDTGYMGSIAALKLSRIEYIELLREYPLPTNLSRSM